MFHKLTNSATPCKALSDSAAALESLIGAIVLKHSPALSALHGCIASQVYAAAHYVVRSKEDAEEIVCDVFMYVWEHAQRYDCRRGTVTAWLTIIARNRAIDLVRKRRRGLSLDDESLIRMNHPPADSDSAEKQFGRWQSGRALHRQLAMLSPLRRQLVQLAFFEGMTHQEIVDKLGIPHGTVKSHIRRALRTMHDEVARNVDSGVGARCSRVPRRCAEKDQSARSILAFWGESTAVAAFAPSFITKIPRCDGSILKNIS